MNRVRTALLAAVALALFATVAVAGSTHWKHSSKTSSPARYMALPGGDTGEELGRMDSYWNDRVTYPTGNYNPAWLRHAAEQADRIPSGIPAGRPQRASSRLAGAATLATDSFVSLGPKPERMTGCGGCFDYTTTAGRVNVLAIDPTT